VEMPAGACFLARRLVMILVTTMCWAITATTKFHKAIFHTLAWNFSGHF